MTSSCSGAEADMELRGLAERLEAVGAEALHAVPDHTEFRAGGNGRRAGRCTHSQKIRSLGRGSTAWPEIVRGRAMPHKGVSTFTLLWSMDRNGAAIALVSPSTLAKSKTRRRPSSAERDPARLLLGLITYERGRPPGPKRPTKRTGRGSGGYRIAKNGRGARERMARCTWETWAKGAGARLKRPAEFVPRAARGKMPRHLPLGAQILLAVAPLRA